MKIYVISKRNMEPGDFDRVILAATTDEDKANKIMEKFRKHNPRTDLRMDILDSEDDTMLKNLWCIKFRKDGTICEITDRSDCAAQYAYVGRKEPFHWDDCNVFFVAADTMSEAIDIASKKSVEYLAEKKREEKARVAPKPMSRKEIEIALENGAVIETGPGKMGGCINY